MPQSRASLSERSIMRPRINRPLSVTRQRIERPGVGDRHGASERSYAVGAVYGGEPGPPISPDAKLRRASADCTKLCRGVGSKANMNLCTASANMSLLGDFKAQYLNRVAERSYRSRRRVV